MGCDVVNAEMGLQGPPGPPGEGITELHGLVHPVSPDVKTDVAFATNNQYIDLEQKTDVGIQLRLTVGGLDMFGIVGDDPELLTADQDFMLSSLGVRVWFNDLLQVDNADIILISVIPTS
jgi:hypothetical protein